MNLNDISLYIDKKIDENEKIIIFSFYELKVKNNLSNQDLEEFLKLSKIRLQNLGYNVYFTGESFKVNNEYKIVNSNELLIAIKIKNNNINEL